MQLVQKKHIQMKIIHLRIIFLVSLIGIICFACNYSEKEAKKKVSQFMGDTLLLPEISEVLYKDSLYRENLPFNKESKLKITTLLWGDCKSCVVDLEGWDELFQLAQAKQDIEIFFYLYTSDFSFFKKSTYENKLHKYPLILDENLNYIDENELPFKNKVYQTFLLNSNNEVILVGNPINNEKLMKLYKEEINKRLN
jgi:hypothetical protein